MINRSIVRVVWILQVLVLVGVGAAEVTCRGRIKLDGGGTTYISNQNHMF